MKGLVLTALKQPLELVERDALEPRAGEVIVQLRAAAFNRRDYWITLGMYPGIELPVILGSDGAGLVSAVGEGVSESWLGQEVIINPGWDWGDDERAQDRSFRILGMPDDGTFATEVRVGADYLHAKPEHLDWTQAAALPLGGLTAYRALFQQGRLQAGEQVLISGIGGGVATLGLQFCLAAGARVFVTSSSPAKIERAQQLGAEGGANYTAEGWSKQLLKECGPFDLILDSAGGEGYADLIDLAKPGGRIVNYGATAGPPPSFDLLKVFWKQLHVIGSTMGSADDFEAMVKFTAEHRVCPVVDNTFSLAEGNLGLELMRDSRQFGKVALTM